ncbi:Imm74 family immunity protein [Orbus mooreae]|uniref:Imm74 family immunity protein n=1 Tax=Orbus mooreae TaxID=3074107 RepID=UPI00370D315D
MKITGTNHYIRVLFDDNHEIVITGELVIGGFYADKNSIKLWEQPYSNEIINEDKKQQIIRNIENYTKNTEMKIIFE